MRRRFVLPLLLCAVVFGPRARSSVLPDACGKEDLSFDIRLEKNRPPPAGPENGKAQVFFIEKRLKASAIIGCLDCRTEARFGVDGAWVGATKDSSYFLISRPGRASSVRGARKRSRCQTADSGSGQDLLLPVEYKAEGTDYGIPGQPNYQVKKNVSFAMLNVPGQGLGPECREAQEEATCRQFLRANDW